MPSDSDQPSRQPRTLWPMDPQITDIQPGSGLIVHLEKAWGKWRRWWLTTFRKGYVQRMAQCRKGTFNPCPHPVLDPRDLKYYQNQGGYYWEPQDDPFQWRNRLPFARAGLAELLVMGSSLLAIALASLCGALKWTGPLSWLLWLVAVAALVFLGIVVWFFRNPRRTTPLDPEVAISPADGKVVEIEEIDHDEYLGGKAIKIGIFLSLFNVHINRTPIPARVIGLKYRPGKFLNAMRPESARENEQVAVMLESLDGCRPMIVRQITGAVARRIVCWVKPGDELQQGQQFGMIKLGSRTELVVPYESGLRIEVKIGDKVKAGESVLLKYKG